MIAKELVSDVVLPLIPKDNLAQSLTMMSIYHVRHLPIVRDDKLLGLLSEEEASSNDPETLIDNVELDNTYVFVNNTDHVFEILLKMAENKITVVPVLDEKSHYAGLITQEDLISYFANSYSFSEPGSIVVIESSKRGYSLSELCRVVELEGATILSSFITTAKNSEAVLITLKINQLNINSIIVALERYDYKIQASFTENKFNEDMQDRYDQLMNYLNV